MPSTPPHPLLLHQHHLQLVACLYHLPHLIIAHSSAHGQGNLAPSSPHHLWPPLSTSLRCYVTGVGAHGEARSMRERGREGEASRHPDAEAVAGSVTDSVFVFGRFRRWWFRRICVAFAQGMAALRDFCACSHLDLLAAVACLTACLPRGSKVLIINLGRWSYCRRRQRQAINQFR